MGYLARMRARAAELRRQGKRVRWAEREQREDVLAQLTAGCCLDTEGRNISIDAREGPEARVDAMTKNLVHQVKLSRAMRGYTTDHGDRKALALLPMDDDECDVVARMLVAREWAEWSERDEQGSLLLTPKGEVARGKLIEALGECPAED